MPTYRPRRAAALRLQLLHWLLTPGAWFGATDAARVRGWARVLDWRAATTLRQRFYLVRRALWTPVREWNEAGHQVAMFGADVNAAAGVAPSVQRRQLWWLAVHHGINAESYIALQLYHPERRRRAAGYLQEPEHTRTVRWLDLQDPNSDAQSFRDKPKFAEWCREHQLPGVPALVEYDEGELVATTLPGDPAASLPRSDLFSKPNDATGGHGAERWRYVSDGDDSGGWVGRDGKLRRAAELLAEIAHTSRTLPLRNERTSRRMLLQRCVRNHCDLLPLTPGALSTVRVLTFRAPGEPSHALVAIYRMAVGDVPADNFHLGGIITAIDFATGRLGVSLRRQGHVLLPIERHPDTGTVIAGHQLPFWNETVALAARGLELARGIPVVGWDIAITDDGPVMIEGNLASNPDIVQALTGIPLSDTPFPAAINAHMRELLES